MCIITILNFQLYIITKSYRLKTVCNGYYTIALNLREKATNLCD